jgi:hypothetical protein
MQQEGLRDYYLEETLDSELARKGFVQPDRTLPKPGSCHGRQTVSGRVLMGVSREIQAVPDDAFVQGTKDLLTRMASRLAFMSREHHVIRDFVVRELPR